MIRIIEVWDDVTAKNVWEFQVKHYKFNDHSCYSCSDDWKWSRRKCPQNTERWETKHSGDKKWAERIAKHYNIKLNDYNE